MSLQSLESPAALDASGKAVYGPDYEFDGRATIVRGHGDQRDSATIISYGAALHEAVAAADIPAGEQRIVRALNAACIRPPDSSAIIQAAPKHSISLSARITIQKEDSATQIADLIADLWCLLASVRCAASVRVITSHPVRRNS